MTEAPPHVLVKRLSLHEGAVVTLKGWLYNARSKGKLHFLQLRDGTGIVQCVVAAADTTPEVFEAAGRLTQEQSFEVTGTVRADPRSPGGYEVSVSALRVIGASPDYPIGPKEHGVDFLMSRRHLWLRSKKQHAVLTVRHRVIKAIRDFFDQRDFTLVDAPIFTPNACEGTSTLFPVPYFDEGTAFLSQSGQLYMEAAAAAFGRAYCFGPTFRAEKSATRRHLTEFWMVEPEVAFMDLEGDMKLMEDFVSYIVACCLEDCGEQFKVLERDTTSLERVVPPFPRISYDDAHDLLVNKLGVAHDDNDDFGAPQETAVSEQFDRPVLIHRYPTAVKAFYFKSDPDKPHRALCCDCIAPEGYGEIIGGGQREDDLAVLERKIAHHGLPAEAFEWYLDIRRYGTFPHAGFGLGLERTVTWITGRPHLREASPFPRLIDRLSP